MKIEVMNEMKVLLLCGFLRFATCAFSNEPSFKGAFFHEPSFTELKPSGHGLETSHFGFSIAYQDSAPANLVVGAPRADFVGKVYSCPLSDLSKAIQCSVVDMTSLDIEKKSKKARDFINPEQNFFFGASVVATKDYFLTCAPFLTKVIPIKIKGVKKPQMATNAYGACYLYNNTDGTYCEWMDNGVRLHDKFSRKYKLTPKTKLENAQLIKAGSVGWNALADNDNGNLLVAKTAYVGDILYVDTNNPLATSKSLVNDYFSSHNVEFNDYFNFGYGLAVGYFFNETIKLYAVSSRRLNLKGRIIFLEKIDSSGTLNILYDLEKSTLSRCSIDNEALSSMFGYALAAADFNQDGLSELLVGAPSQSDDGNQREFGALHIYVGGDLLSRNDKNRMRTVLGNEENGRFGSAIATNDIDGDNIPEIFISAPYENSGVGTVYVISGYEINQVLFKNERFKQIKLSDLKLTQRLQGDSGSKLFGFSLQIVKDIDDNGCDELAVGSPANSAVRLMRCLPVVNTSISLELIGEEIVKEDAVTFTVSVCLNVKISPKYKSVVGSILVKSNVTGATNIPVPTFKHELSTKREQDHCENITVNLVRSESAEYTFSTIINILDVDKNGNRKGKDYYPWAVLSHHSEVEKNIVIKRYCTGKECEPKLSYEMSWSGGKVIDTSSAHNETITIVVHNAGHDAKLAYVRLTTEGVRISSLSNSCFRENETAVYTCSLNPVKRDSSVSLKVLLNMNELTNVPQLNITAQLHDKVFPNINYEAKHLDIEYKLDPSPVLLNGSRHVLNVTDMDLEERSNIVSFTENHEYYISNNGPVKWTNILAILKIRNDSFIQKVKIITTEVCQQQYSTDVFDHYYLGQIVFHCFLTLKPRAVKKIIASIEISKKIIEIDIIEKKLGITSELSFCLPPTNETRRAKSSTQINYKKILTFGNKKELVMIICVIAAVTLMLLLIFVLYKLGFFKRTQKEKLVVLRENVRKQSIRKTSESSRSHKPSTADGDGCDIEVVDDCAFQDIAIPSPDTGKDDAVLI